MTDQTPDTPAQDTAPDATGTPPDTDFLDALASEDKPADGGEFDFLPDGADDKPDSDKPADEPAPAPEDYSWEPPEDMKTEWANSPETAKEFEAFQAYAKEKGLKGEVFKELMGKYATQTKALSENIIKGLVEENQRQTLEWQKAILADKDLGGQNYKESKSAAILAISQLGGKEAAAALRDTGLGANPAVFKMLVNAGRMLKEGGHVAGQKVQPQVPLAKLLFPNV